MFAKALVIVVILASGTAMARTVDEIAAENYAEIAAKKSADEAAKNPEPKLEDPPPPAALVALYWGPKGWFAVVQKPGGGRVMLSTGDDLGKWRVERITEDALQLRKGKKTHTIKYGETMPALEATPGKPGLPPLPSPFQY